MKIALHEIKEGLVTELVFDEAEHWLSSAVKKADEEPKLSDVLAKFRKINFQVAMQKIDEVYMVSGKLATYIVLNCSRCAHEFKFSCNLQFSMLFCKDPVMAGQAHISKEEGSKPMLTNHSFARHAHDWQEDEDGSYSTIDITYLSQDLIDLSEVVVEQLQLEVPLAPLCQGDCKGLCLTCGSNLNVGRCACSKIKKENVFSSLIHYNGFKNGSED